MTSELFQDNYEAKCAYQILKSMNRPVFLTGRAGTGKSTFIEWAKTITKKCLVLAPTAVAARHIGGRTIHSVFKLPPRLI
jgi:predicted ribonuclease YlaK